jgi:hypothetical protein
VAKALEMETREFAVPSGDWASRALPFVLLVSSWIIALSVMLASRSFALSHKGIEVVCAIASVLSLFILFVALSDSSLSYTVHVKQGEIVQFPWLGSPRAIKWDEIKRIQFLDLEGYRGQRAYRIRVFSESTVITFNSKLSDCYDLVKILQDKAEHLSIPIYREDSIGQSRLVFGSWSLDSSGASAGVPVTRVGAISTP